MENAHEVLASHDRDCRGQQGGRGIHRRQADHNVADLQGAEQQPKQGAKHHGLLGVTLAFACCMRVPAMGVR